MDEDRDSEIRQLVEKLQAAQSDVDPFLALHTQAAIIVNFGGRRVLGSGDLRRAMEAGLASPLAQVITTAEIDDIRYVRPDVAIVSCTKHVSDQRDTTETFATEGRLTYVAVEEDGAWPSLRRHLSPGPDRPADAHPTLKEQRWNQHTSTTSHETPTSRRSSR